MLGKTDGKEQIVQRKQNTCVSVVPFSEQMERSDRHGKPYPLLQSMHSAYKELSSGQLVEG